MPETVSTHDARRELSQLLERVHYTGTQIQISRNKRPMAWLVGVPFMENLVRLVNTLAETDPALADTLELMLDQDVMETLREGEDDVKHGNVVPIEQLLERPDAA